MYKINPGWHKANLKALLEGIPTYFVFHIKCTKWSLELHKQHLNLYFRVTPGLQWALQKYSNQHKFVNGKEQSAQRVAFPI